MTAITNTNNGLSVKTRMVPLSPYELYLEQLRGVSDTIRVNSMGMSYIPPQFGGLKGQIIALNDQPVVQMVDFENRS